MKDKLLQWLGVTAIIVVGIIHFLLAPVEYAEAQYVGILFGANFLGAIVAALGILRGKAWAWMLGLLVAIGSISGYTVSRTIGLPGHEVEAWFSPYGVVAMAAEGIFVLLASLKPWKIDAAGDEGLSIPAWLRYGLPVAALSIVILTSVLAAQWESASGGGDDHALVSVDQLRTTPPVSHETLEEDYGVQVSLVAVSAMNSIVDVRLKILDVEKADRLLDNHAAILVDKNTLVLSAHMHRHRLKQGKIYVIFYPNPQNVVKSGTPVSLVFGNLALEPIAAR
jgi:hypothetical protein